MAPPAWGRADSTCLTGDDPAVAVDADQIAALEDLIAATCPCAEFDGSDGKSKRAYRRCAGSLLSEATKNGALRNKCKARVKKAYARSNCGYPEDFAAVTCIERSSRGKVGCRVMAAEKCVDNPGRVTRVTCSEAERCVDAADDNGDYLVDSRDSAECRSSIPTTTATASATATEMIADTATPTSEPTATPTDTPPATPVDTATDTPTQLPSATPTPTHCTASGPIIPHIDVNLDDDPQSPPVPPDPRANNCVPQSINAGGCAINPLDGTIANYFDASATVDNSRCPGDPAPSYHWELFKPPGLAGAPYASAGISGYHGPVLTILPNSLPSLAGTDAGQDIFWRVRLTVTSNAGTGQSTESYFRFDYQQSSLTLQASTDCQMSGFYLGADCAIEYPNSLPPNEPT